MTGSPFAGTAAGARVPHPRSPARGQVRPAVPRPSADSPAAAAVHRAPPPHPSPARRPAAPRHPVPQVVARAAAAATAENRGAP
ncbi:hypothetical protein ACFQ0M_41615 [Kitasatospora aburaviensis]